MGDPKRPRRKYEKPHHPWNKARIEEEAKLRQEYGFRTKHELWKCHSILRDITAQAKESIAATSAQAQKEKQLLIQRLNRLGLVQPTATIDEVLSIKLKDILERRLQTLVFRKGMAKTVKQARQMITHEHIMVKGKKITSPNYLVPREEEATVAYAGNSAFVSTEHPERAKIAQKA